MYKRQGIGSASVVLEAMTESGSSTELCLVCPALRAMPVVGPVTRGHDLYWRLLIGQQVLPIQCGSSAYAKRYLEYYCLLYTSPFLMKRDTVSGPAHSDADKNIGQKRRTTQ